jgi:hypothetical protein
VRFTSPCFSAPRGTPANESTYILRRDRGRWTVLYDGIVTNRLVSFATKDAIGNAMSGENASKPTAVALAAGGAADQPELRRVTSVLAASMQFTVTTR